MRARSWSLLRARSYAYTVSSSMINSIYTYMHMCSNPHPVVSRAKGQASEMRIPHAKGSQRVPLWKGETRMEICVTAAHVTKGHTMKLMNAPHLPTLGMRSGRGGLLKTEYA